VVNILLDFSFLLGHKILARGGGDLARGQNIIMGQPFIGSQVIGPSWNLGNQQPPWKRYLGSPSRGGTHHAGPSNHVFLGLNPGHIFPELPKLDPLTCFPKY
jgi:hypothetical protein